MNGYDLCKKAYLRLGFDNQNNITLHNRSAKRDLEFLNQIAEDLRLKPINELSCELSYSNEECEALCIGVAMLLSFSEGEADKNKLYTIIYNAKRAALLGKNSKIEDVLPVVGSGDI